MLLAFADDFKLFLRIDSNDDCVLLLDKFSSLALWLDNHHLSLNIHKCQVMTFTRRRSPVSFDYSLKDHSLTRASIKTDLGIIITSNLDYHSDHRAPPVRNVKYLVSKRTIIGQQPVMLIK